ARDERNDQVFASKADSENGSEKHHRFARRREKQQRDRAADKPVDQQHDVLPRNPIRKPSHQHPSGDAEGQHEGNNPGRFVRRVVLIEAEEEFKMLIGAANRAYRTHAAEGKQVESRVSEDFTCRSESTYGGIAVASLDPLFFEYGHKR